MNLSDLSDNELDLAGGVVIAEGVEIVKMFNGGYAMLENGRLVGYFLPNEGGFVYYQTPPR